MTTRTSNITRCPDCGHDDLRVTRFWCGTDMEPGSCDIECLCATRADGCDCTFGGEVTLL